MSEKEKQGSIKRTSVESTRQQQEARNNLFNQIIDDAEEQIEENGGSEIELGTPIYPPKKTN